MSTSFSKILTLYLIQSQLLKRSIYQGIMLPESLFYKINTCLQKTTTCIGLQAEEMFSVNI